MTTRGVAAAVLALTLFAGCGIPIDDSARPLAGDEVPSTVPVPAPPPAAPAGDLSLTVELFLIRGSGLTPVNRLVPAPLTADKAITEIVRGPTPLERGRGLRSALPRSVRLLGTVAHDVPLIDVTESLTGVDGEEQILALAQLVFTLTGLPGVNGVSFARDGRPVEVPTGDGELRGGPLRRQDFAAVAPL
jgi:hypothetical protein